MLSVEIDPAYYEVLEWLRPQLTPWRKLTIVIDGVDGSGKSSLARFLAWQLGMPAIETDLALSIGSGSPRPKSGLVKALISSRHRNNRPVIVEGVFILQTLAEVGIDPDLIIRVELAGHTGSFVWKKKFSRYETTFIQSRAPDFLLKRAASSPPDPEFD